MTRIVAGTVGGRVLQVPRAGTRPTSERVREALFSRLEHLDVVDGARVLDLYAGSGALGIEAASRGAAHVTLVESARDAADVCRAQRHDARSGGHGAGGRGEGGAVRRAAGGRALGPGADRPAVRPARGRPGGGADRDRAGAHGPRGRRRRAGVAHPGADLADDPGALDRRAYGDTVMWFAELAES